jgi:hypothetical protein
MAGGAVDKGLFQHANAVSRAEQQASRSRVPRVLSPLTPRSTPDHVADRVSRPSHRLAVERGDVDRQGALSQL